MKYVLFLSSSPSDFAVSGKFDGDALPGEEKDAQVDALYALREYVDAEIAKRLPAPDERTERPIEAGE